MQSFVVAKKGSDPRRSHPADPVAVLGHVRRQSVWLHINFQRFGLSPHPAFRKPAIPDNGDVGRSRECNDHVRLHSAATAGEERDPWPRGGDRHPNRRHLAVDCRPGARHILRAIE